MKTKLTTVLLLFAFVAFGQNIESSRTVKVTQDTNGMMTIEAICPLYNGDIDRIKYIKKPNRPFSYVEHGYNHLKEYSDYSGKYEIRYFTDGQGVIYDTFPESELHQNADIEVWQMFDGCSILLAKFKGWFTESGCCDKPKDRVSYAKKFKR